MQEQHPSARTLKRGQRGARFLAGSVALTMATFGGLAAITALPASAATITTSDYTIGSPSAAVTNVTVSPTSATASSSAVGFAVKFTATHALTNASADTLTIGISPALATAPAAVTLIDDSASTCFQSGTNSGTDTISTVTVILNSNCSIASGDTAEVDFTANTPSTSSSPLAFTVSSTENSAAGAVDVTLNSVPPTVTTGSQSFGAIPTYTITGVPLAGLTTTPTTVTVTSVACGASVTAPCSTDGNTGTGTVTWQTGGAYTVTYTASGGSAVADPVTGASASGGTLTLTLTNAIAESGTLTISGPGANPAATTPTSEDYFTVTPTGGTTEKTSNTVVFGTSVTGVTVTPSPTVAGASSTYTVNFKSPDGVPLNGTIKATETAGANGTVTNFGNETGVLVDDTTGGWHCVATPITAVGDSISIPITAAAGCSAIAAGDLIAVTIGGVTNPGSGTISDFDVSTSVDSVASPASSFSIGASGSAGVQVALSSNLASATDVTYTISNFYASTAIPAGSSINLTAPAGTLVPDAASYFVLTDSTTAAGSGAGATITNWVSNGSGMFVTFTTTNAITSGDLLSLTISDVDNPGTSSGTDTIELGGLLALPSAIAPFPDANVTYPNGSIIDFAGTDYMFAGGHAFGIATPTLLTKLQAVDHAAVLKAAAGAIVPTAGIRAGTLITTNSVNGNATIYVAGTDGDLHGFVTGASFLGDGYDPALTVTVPTLGGLTTGSTASVEGTAVTAAATSADGAIVDSSGTYYVFDGGRAFGIPTPAALTIVRKSDMATPLTGTVGVTQTGATIATGVLLTVNGEVYVSFVANIFPFKSEAQLSADGYAGTAAITATNLGGLGVVTGYSGS